MGAADTALRFSNDSPWDVIKIYWHNSHHFQYWTTISSTIYGALPGFLTLLYPWLYWSPLIVCITSLITWLILPNALGLNISLLWAALACSGTLSALLVLGYPYVPETISYSLALMAILGRHKKPLAWRSCLTETLLWIFIYQFSAEVSEPARSVAMLPLLGSLSVSATPIGRRVYWICVSSIMLYGFSAMDSTSMNLRFLTEATPDLLAAAKFSFYWIYRAIVESRLDYLSFIILGFLSLFFIKENRIFWYLLFALQLCLIAVLAARSFFDHYIDYEVLRARRFVLTSFVLALIIAKAAAEASPSKARVFKSLIFLAMLPPLVGAIQFYLQPNEGKILPFMDSSVDFAINPSMNEDALRLSRFSSSSSLTQAVTYGFSRYSENSTDPVCFMERTLLVIGPDRFKSRILMVDGWAENPIQCRYSCIPTFPKTAIIKLVEQPNCQFNLHVYKDPFCKQDECLLQDELFNHKGWIAQVLENMPIEVRSIEGPKMNNFKSFEVRCL